MLFQATIAPGAALEWPAVYLPGYLALFPVAYHVKYGFIAALSSDVLHLNAPALPNNLVGLSLKLHHRRQVSRDSVGSPYLRMGDPVQRPSQLLDSAQASQRIFVS